MIFEHLLMVQEEEENGCVAGGIFGEVQRQLIGLDPLLVSLFHSILLQK